MKLTAPFALIDCTSGNFFPNSSPCCVQFRLNAGLVSIFIITFCAFNLLSCTSQVKKADKDTVSQPIISDSTKISNNSANFKSEFVVPLVNAALKDKAELGEFTRLLNDPTVNFFMNSHPDFNFVFFAYTDAAYRKLASPLRDSIARPGYNETKFKFFANHVSMVSKGVILTDGVNFNEKSVTVSDGKLKCGDQNYKIVKSPENPNNPIQIFIIDHPISF
ncbi:MAG: hypothetical protein IPO72_08845 [Saprospiraceae bacterium]|nr:hypothetical protein [Candidatus Vicinibacter affinis]HQX45694.1 hypothetical protein [Saprospiraceae bacterium]